MAATDAILALFAALPLASLLFLLLAYRAHQKKPLARFVVLGNVLVFVLLIGALLFSGEFYYRFAYDKTDGLGVTLTSKRWMQRHYHRNNFDVRDNIDLAMEIAPGKPRISIVGDSFTAGYGVPDVENRFVNILRKTNPRWEVHGIAWGGANTGTLTQRLRQLHSDGYEFDQVLYVYMINDLDDLVGELRAAIEEVRVEEPGFLSRHSYLLNTLFYRFKVAYNEDMMDYFGMLEEAYTLDLWQLQEARLEDLTTFVRESGGALLVVTFPFFETLDSARYGSIHRKLSEHWETAGVPHLDLRSVFAGLQARELTVGRYDTHPNEYAHRLAAEAMQAFLRQQASSDF